MPSEKWEKVTTLLSCTSLPYREDSLVWKLK